MALEEEVKKALLETNASMPVDELRLGAALHRSASKVLAEAAEHQAAEWTLLSALQEGYERVRSLNAESIERALRTLSQEVIATVSVDTNNTIGTEAQALSYWRQRAEGWKESHLTVYTAAESNFLEAVGSVLAPGYERIVEDALGVIKDDTIIRSEDAVVNLLKEAEKIGAEAVIAARTKAYSGQNDTKIPEVIKRYSFTLAQGVVQKSKYRELNEAKAEAGRIHALETAMVDFETCLTATSTAAKLGLTELGAGRVCEAEASMTWLEREETEPELDLRKVRPQRRDAAAKRLQQFREAGENAKRLIDKYLNVSTPGLRAQFEKHGCGIDIISESTLSLCESTANKAIDLLLQDAIKAVNKVLGLTQDTQVELLLTDKAQPLRDIIKRWKTEAHVKSAQASTDCARRAISLISRKVKRAQRIADAAVNKDAISFLVRHYAYRPPTTDLFSVPSNAIVDGELCIGSATQQPEYQQQIKSLRRRATQAKSKHDTRLSQARATISLLVIGAAFLDLFFLLCCGPLCLGASWASYTNGLARSAPLLHASLCLMLIVLGLLAFMEFSLRLQDPYLPGNQNDPSDDDLNRAPSSWWPSSKNGKKHSFFSREGAGHLLAVFVVFTCHFLCCCSCCCSRLGRKANRKLKLKAAHDDHIL